jgi:hypothetical protein
MVRKILANVPNRFLKPGSLRRLLAATGEDMVNLVLE